MASVMASAAQWERRIIGQRTKDALEARLGRAGGAPRPSTDHAASDARRRSPRPGGDDGPSSRPPTSSTANGVPTAHARPDGPVTKWHPSTVSKVLEAHARGVYEAVARRDRRERRRMTTPPPQPPLRISRVSAVYWLHRGIDAHQDGRPARPTAPSTPTPR